MSTNRARQARQSAGRSGQSGKQRQPRPLPNGETLFTPDSSPARASIERASATPLLWLHQLPTWLLPILAVALLVAGLAVRTWPGAVALCGVAAILGWLAVLSWPRLNVQGRLLRVAVIAAVVAIAAYHALH